jgi:hypothetical protein
MTTTNPPVELIAELIVENAYDRARSRRPFDTTGNRRYRALTRLEERLDAELRRRGMARDDVDRGNAPRGALERALERAVNRRIRPGTYGTSDAVAAALEDVRVELELVRPLRLDRELNGDGRFGLYAAGASRSRRPRR